jgi:hypothetical protein
MLRKRLLSIVGTVGLLAAVVSSGIGAQAGTAPGPDATYNSLLATYQYSSQNTCYSNVGGAVSAGGTCTITQNQSSTRNIAVCVQDSNEAAPIQTCSISQTNGTYNNYALVVQRIQQGSCALIGPCQSGTQLGSIKQTTTSSGWNFGGAFQTTLQAIGQPGVLTQTNTQHVEFTAPSTGPGGLEQLSTEGSNYGAVAQVSAQSASGTGNQTQNAEQVAGHSGIGGSGIDQKAPLGSNAAALVQIHKQRLDNSMVQNQTASEDGDITQNGVPGTNLASGSQFEDQQEQGPFGAVQHQLGDPKCCSVQNGGQFFATIFTNQFANHIAASGQTEFIYGNCDSVPSSAPNGCHVSLSATQQNTTTSIQCSGTHCHPIIFCVEGAPCAASQTNIG